MNESKLQIIFDKLQGVLPEKWNEIVLFVGYTVGSYSMKYYLKNSKGEYVDCFQEGPSKVQLIKLFMEIDKEIANERNKLDDMHRWSVLTMIVDNQGNMKTEFDYCDISENFISYENAWKDKYLRKIVN